MTDDRIEEAAAKADCERLLEVVLPLAEQMLGTHREFFPYGGAMKPGGEIVSIGALGDGDEAAPPDQMIGQLKAAFIQGARDGAYRATALVYDVTVTDVDGEAANAIAASLNHRDGYSVIVLMPYGFEGKDLVCGDLTAQAGESDIFPPAR
ncbi:MAG: hypothetical protein JWP35_3009 [Caulobacter sp.]|nr:hypothetical protein [Caulobacter sp.]